MGGKEEQDGRGLMGSGKRRKRTIMGNEKGAKEGVVRTEEQERGCEMGV